METFFKFYFMRYLAILLLFISQIINAQSIYFVNQAIQGGKEDGSSWEHAAKDLAKVMRQSKNGDQIWVAKGTYFPTTDNSRDSSFILQKGVKIYGGFEGVEKNIQERSIEKNETKLSGDIGTLKDSSDNTFSIIVAIDVDSTNTIDGFTITNGYSIGNPTFPISAKNSGSGIFIQSIYPIGMRIVNCKIIKNEANNGAGIYSNQSLNFDNNIIESNYADFSGGGVYLDCPLQQKNNIFNCIFLNNKNRYQGGGMFISGNHNTFYIKNCRFDNNFGLNPDGLGISNSTISDTFYFKNINVINNKVKYNGVVFYFINDRDISNVHVEFDSCNFLNNYMGTSEGGLISFYLYDNNYYLGINNCLFNSNFNSVGCIDVEVSNSKGEMNIKNSKFLNNKSNIPTLSGISYYGRGLNSSDNIINLDNCVFAKNDGAFTMVNESGSSLAFITNCTFFNNGEYPFFKQDTKEGKNKMINKIYLRNCIVWETFHPKEIRYGRVIFQQNSTIQGQTQSLRDYFFYNNMITDIDSCWVPWFPGPICENNIFNRYPEFKDTLKNDFSLLPCSPLINKGDRKYIDSLGISYDLAGNPRIYQDSVDMGAYESQTKCTVDITELDNNTALELIPNLVTSGTTIQIQLKETTNIENYHLSIYDIGGQHISTMPLNNNLTFEAPKEKGFYIVQLLIEKRIEGIGKLVVVD